MYNRKKNSYTPGSLPQLLSQFPVLDISDYLEAENECERHCTKYFCLKNNVSPSDWTIPSTDIYVHGLWQVAKLHELKFKLNQVKNKLESYDLEKWHQHTHNCNPAAKIPHSIKMSCKPQLQTQASLKFYEILHAFPLLYPACSSQNDTLKSLHLCEAPGAFIVALNHFLAIHFPDMQWDWLGNTLNPYFEGNPHFECITDDRLILFTLGNWFFGDDQTGNLLSRDYLDQLTNLVKQKGGMDLVTADGSVDCQEKPGDQEIMTHSLHLCEVFGALSSLKEGGSFILKMFTFFETESLNLLYIISCCFREVHVCKPITSKLGNSEVYVVAMGFNSSGSLNLLLNALRDKYENIPKDKMLFGSSQIPISFVSRVIECAEFFSEHQISAIERNIRLFNSNTRKNIEYMELLKRLTLCRFHSNNICAPIHGSKNLVKKFKHVGRIPPEESYSKRLGQSINKISKEQRLKLLDSFLENLVTYYSKDFVEDENKSNYSRRDINIDQPVLSFLDIKKGRPFNFVYGSKFCHPYLLRIYFYFVNECTSEEEIQIMNNTYLHELKTLVGNIPYKDSIEQEFKTITNDVEMNFKSTSILDEQYTLPPQNSVRSLCQLCQMIKKGELNLESDVVFINCPLLTRSQVGILSILGSLFEKITFCEPSKSFESIPYFVFRSFKNITQGKAVIEALYEGGCDLKLNSQNIPNEIISIQYLLNSPFFGDICRYNAFYCLNKISHIRKLL